MRRERVIIAGGGGQGDGAAREEMRPVADGGEKDVVKLVDIVDVHIVVTGSESRVYLSHFFSKKIKLLRNVYCTPTVS